MHDRTRLVESAELLERARDHTKAHHEIEEAVHAILRNVGENPDRAGLRKTPERVARMYDELLAGYRIEPIALINDATFKENYEQMIVVKDIDFFSLCEH